MGLRPGRVLKCWKRPWTRVSKTKPRKSYVVGVPFPKIHVFESGTKGKYEVEVVLVSKKDVQIRDNALESARIVSNKLLDKKLVGNYFYKMLVYPHNVIREHNIASGAGADRYSQGMAHPFGGPVGKSAIVKKGQELILIRVNKKDIPVAKEALRRANSKIRCTTQIIVKE